MLDTPNNGGVYKAWVTFTEDYVCSLDVVDCGYVNGPDAHRHGFVPAHSKTDNFKVGTHKITIANQPGCQVAHIVYDGVETNGPRTVSVAIKNINKDKTVFIDVYCD